MKFTGLGKRVIGEKAAKEEQVVQERKEHILGPRVIGERDTPTTRDPGKEDVDPADLPPAERLIHGSVKKLEKVLPRVNSAEIVAEALQLEEAGDARKTAKSALRARLSAINAQTAEKEGMDRTTGKPRETGDDSDEGEGEDGEGASDPTDPEATSIDPNERTDDNRDGYVSVEELEKAIEANPALLDRAIKAEFERQPGPRIGALRLLLECEHQREDGPREDVTTALEHALGGSKE